MSRVIDDMIETIADNPPDFLDLTKMEHHFIFEKVSQLILMSKLLAVDRIITTLGINNFTEGFYKIVEEMILEFDQDITEMCYEYVNDFYKSLINHLESIEKYEMCANFHNFMNAFNKKF